MLAAAIERLGRNGAFEQPLLADPIVRIDQKSLVAQSLAVGAVEGQCPVLGPSPRRAQFFSAPTIGFYLRDLHEPVPNGRPSPGKIGSRCNDQLRESKGFASAVGPIFLAILQDRKSTRLNSSH